MKKQEGVKDESDGYQFKVITYIATCLSRNQYIENYTIYSEVQNIPIFEDVIIKINFKNNPDPYCYLCQVKHRASKINFNREKHNLDAYVKSIEIITHKKNEIALLQDVPSKNIEFWFYSNNYVNIKEIDKGKYTLKGNPGCTSLFHSIDNVKCQKLIPIDDERQQYLNAFHFILNQANTWKIQYQIQELHDNFTKEMSETLVKYIDKYFNRPKIDGLSKNIFESELLRIHLSNMIVKPVKISEINEEHAQMWNKITLNHEITIIEEMKDVEMKVFGCFLHRINELYDCDLDWNDCVDRGGKIGENFDVRKFVDNSKSKNERHWNSTPDSIENLMVEMWKTHDLPLLLKSTGDVSVLTRYKYLKKYFVIIGQAEKIFDQVQPLGMEDSSPLKFFTDIFSINDTDLREEFLKGVSVSLQGRKPTALYNIIDGDQHAMKELTCAKILHLIKKRRFYLQKECLDSSEMVANIIIANDVAAEYDLDFDNIDYQTNVVIECKEADIKLYQEKIKAHSKLKNYKMLCLKADNDKYQPLMHEQIDEHFKKFAVDQEGCDIYGFGSHKLAPVLGKRIGKNEENYIQRRLSVKVLEKAIFNEMKRRIIFLRGDLQSLSSSIKSKLVIEWDDEEIESKLEGGQTVLVDANNLDFEAYWASLTTVELLYVILKDGYPQLMKHKNCFNINRYVSAFFKRKFKEEEFYNVFQDKVGIISGEPGIGKSTLLKSLAETYKEDHYVLYCNLSECRHDLQRDGKELQRPLDYMFEKSENSTYKNFLRKIYNHHRDSGKMVLFLDSFDEILPYYKDRVLSILDKIAGLNVKVLISSRTHADSTLVQKLETEPINIERLDFDEVKNYLEQKKLIRIDPQRIPCDLLENPLYLQFLIFLHREDVSNFTKMDRFDLYKKFIYKKVERYHKKYKLDYNPSLELLIYETLKHHRLMALVVIFGRNVLEEEGVVRNYDVLAKKFKALEFKFGIVKCFDENDFPVFSHHTFAELLAMEWIDENVLVEPSADRMFRKIALEWNRYVRHLCDSMICKEQNLHKAILKGDTRLVDELCLENDVNLREVDKLGRTALHLASSYCTKKSVEEHHLDFLNINYEVVEVIIGHMRNNGIDFNAKDSFMEWNWIEFLRHYNGNAWQTHEAFLKNELFWAAERDLKNYAEYLLDIEKIPPGETKTTTTPFEFSTLKPIHLAAWKSSGKLVKILIDYGADVMSTAEGGCTPLHYAAKNKHSDVISYLLDIDVNQSSDNGETPLHLACASKNTNAVVELLKRGADPKLSDKEGKNALHHSVSSEVSNDDEAALKIITNLNDHDVDLTAEDNLGNTPLHYACKENFERVARYLISILGKDTLCLRNGKGRTPFHLACVGGHAEIVEYLLGVDPEIRASDNYGNTCLHLAARSESKSVMSALVKKMDLKEGERLEGKNHLRRTPLHISALYGSHNVTEFLLRKGVDPNPLDADGNTPLHLVCTVRTLRTISRHPRVRTLTQKISRLIKTLLKHGADIEARNNSGETALHLAVLNTNADIIGILLKKADVNACNSRMQTPLHVAAKRCDPKTISLLLKHRTYVNARDDIEQTPLHVAAGKGLISSIKLLLDGGANVRACNNSLETPLHVAVKCSRSSLIKLLVKRGSEVNAKDLNGKTALHLEIMKKKSSVDTIKFLLEHGADPNVQNNEDDSVMDIAKQLGKERLLREL